MPLNHIPHFLRNVNICMVYTGNSQHLSWHWEIYDNISRNQEISRKKNGSLHKKTQVIAYILCVPVLQLRVVLLSPLFLSKLYEFKLYIQHASVSKPSLPIDMLFCIFMPAGSFTLLKEQWCMCVFIWRSLIIAQHSYWSALMQL